MTILVSIETGKPVGQLISEQQVDGQRMFEALTADGYKLFAPSSVRVEKLP